MGARLQTNSAYCRFANKVVHVANLERLRLMSGVIWCALWVALESGFGFGFGFHIRRCHRLPLLLAFPVPCFLTAPLV